MECKYKDGKFIFNENSAIKDGEYVFVRMGTNTFYIFSPENFDKKVKRLGELIFEYESTSLKACMRTILELSEFVEVVNAVMPVGIRAREKISYDKFEVQIMDDYYILKGTDL